MTVAREEETSTGVQISCDDVNASKATPPPHEEDEDIDELPTLSPVTQATISPDQIMYSSTAEGKDGVDEERRSNTGGTVSIPAQISSQGQAPSIPHIPGGKFRGPVGTDDGMIPRALPSSSLTALGQERPPEESSEQAETEIPSELSARPTRLSATERMLGTGLHHNRQPSTIYEEGNLSSTSAMAGQPAMMASQAVKEDDGFVAPDADRDPNHPLTIAASAGLSLDNSESSNEDEDESPPSPLSSARARGEAPGWRETTTNTGGLSGLRKSQSMGALHMQNQLQRQTPCPQQPNQAAPEPPQPHSVPEPRPFAEEAPRVAASSGYYSPLYRSTKLYQFFSQYLLKKHYYTPFSAATWIGFWALMHVTCSNYVLMPLRDAIALQVGVKHIPMLTLISTILAFFSSVPIGWLFEAPDPNRRRLWKKMGLTRGDTQGTSLALFYRCFAIALVSYATAFTILDRLLHWYEDDSAVASPNKGRMLFESESNESIWASLSTLSMHQLLKTVNQLLYVSFFLVVHLMKLHSISLVWGVTTEAMEYEEEARLNHTRRSQQESNRTRLQRLALVGFGGTMGGILGSVLASSMAQLLRLPGLLLLASCLLEVAAELSIELGHIMQLHWEGQQQKLQEQSRNGYSSRNLTSLDTSMKRSASLGSMKRVASGNSLHRVKSSNDFNRQLQQKQQQNRESSAGSGGSSGQQAAPEAEVNDDSFTQRLLRGVRTILRSRLLMAIFTYNALYASTNVLLSFQRAALVANRGGANATAPEADTAFLAKVNMASSIAIFLLQASGTGAHVAHVCGQRGTLALMPLVRLAGVLSLAWWHRTSEGQPPNLLVFLLADECCKIMNLAVAKPVRESLWRGLSNEARYEAKPIVDTLANRWGGGSAAFLVSFFTKLLDLLGVQPQNGVRHVFGFPPILFLCLVIASWWAVVSADLGQIRRRIDLELKKRA